MQPDNAVIVGHVVNSESFGAFPKMYALSALVTIIAGKNADRVRFAVSCVWAILLVQWVGGPVSPVIPVRMRASVLLRAPPLVSPSLPPSSITFRDRYETGAPRQPFHHDEHTPMAHWRAQAYS